MTYTIYANPENYATECKACLGQAETLAEAKTLLIDYVHDIGYDVISYDEAEGGADLAAYNGKTLRLFSVEPK